MVTVILSGQHLSRWHLSISGISQLLLIRFWPNFSGSFLGLSLTVANCHDTICSGNICPGDICTYQQSEDKLELSSAKLRSLSWVEAELGKIPKPSKMNKKSIYKTWSLADQEKILALLASWSFHQKPTAKHRNFPLKGYFPLQKNRR